MTQQHAVGIDLGTTFSSLAYVDAAGHLTSLALEDGGFTIASAVYFKSEHEVVVGDEALAYSMIYPDRVARKFKREMCKEGAGFTCDGKTHRPEELSAIVLKTLLQHAEPTLGRIERAVISVPFVFDEARRQATIDAGHIAGLKDVDLVDEPVAAGIAYGNKLFASSGRWGSDELEDLFADETILVYDLGGGTFDATIMRIGGDASFEVLSTTGDWELGGEDWDDVLLNRVCDEYEAATGESIRDQPDHMQELRLKAIDAKKALSERSRTEFDVSFGRKRVTITLHRGDFERDTRFLVTRTTDSVGEMLEQAGKTWSHIDRILLVGGSSRMPMINKHLSLITGRTFDMSLSPDTAIAQGAALFAAFHAGNRHVAVRDVSTVNSHALGLEVFDPQTGQCINDVILPANQPTLKDVQRTYRMKDKNKGVLLNVLLGSVQPDLCVRLGQLRIAPTRAEGNPEVRVSYCFRENGMLAVEGVVIPPNGKPQRAQAEIVVDGKMSDEEVSAATTALRGIEFS